MSYCVRQFEKCGFKKNTLESESTHKTKIFTCSVLRLYFYNNFEYKKILLRTYSKDVIKAIYAKKMFSMFFTYHTWRPIQLLVIKIDNITPHHAVNATKTIMSSFTLIMINFKQKIIVYFYSRTSERYNNNLYFCKAGSQNQYKMERSER